MNHNNHTLHRILTAQTVTSSNLLTESLDFPGLWQNVLFLAEALPEDPIKISAVLPVAWQNKIEQTVLD